MINIITICSNNFGNRLQNYALSRVLQTLTDDQVVTLQFKDGTSAQSLGALASRLLWWKHAALRNFKESSRQVAPFLRFTANNIPTALFDPKDLKSRKGTFVIGSDQCWNPSWNIGSRLDGAQCAWGVDGSRKVAYAASVGIAYQDLGQEWRERYSRWLSDIPSIAMREFEGSEIVEALTGRKAPTVLDPTMLLSASDWERLERRPREDFPFESGYVFTYCLGAESLAGMQPEIEQMGKPVYSLGKVRSGIGPEEFLWLIHHADCIWTDSFHATVFSLLFHRPFEVLVRKDGNKSMSSRFETLDRLFHIGGRFRGSDSFSADKDFLVDWGAFEGLLQEQRAFSLNWLKRALREAES